jgi:hypothetical protein
MPDEADAEVLEVLGRQLRQYRRIDRVVEKSLFVLLHAEAAEPGCDIHAAISTLASLTWSPPRGLTLSQFLVASERSGRLAGQSHAVAVLVVDRIVVDAAIVPRTPSNRSPSGKWQVKSGRC